MYRTDGDDGWWRWSAMEAADALKARDQGLSHADAAERLRITGPNELRKAPGHGMLRAVMARLRNPLLLVLSLASLVSALTGDYISAWVILVILAMSVVLDVTQEHRANQSVEALRQSLLLRCRVRRDGAVSSIAAVGVVPGDVVLLSAGDLAPADGILLASTDFFVDQSSLTGEPYPVEKSALGQARPAVVADSLDGGHTVHMGSSVLAGSATMLVCATGPRTQLGSVARCLAQDQAPSAFERGMHRFSAILFRVTTVMVLLVLLINAMQGRPPLDSFVFSVALAVGLTPELLPMIVSVTLAHGAVRLAREGVIVKRASSVQDLGAIDILCTDKTGTLTEARMRVVEAVDPEGQASEEVLRWAWLNSHFETGILSPLDEAILEHRDFDASAWAKVDEVPFDFERRRISVLLTSQEERVLVLKGAPEEILRLSASVKKSGMARPLDAPERDRINALIDALASEGLRSIGVAFREIPRGIDDVSAADEHDFTFLGLVAFADPPKATARNVIGSLADHGVKLKILTGDSTSVTQHLCKSLGIGIDGILSGQQIAAMDDASLRARVDRVNLFCRVTPEQKNRVVRALQAAGHVVGYMGDGVNDAPPLRSADVGVSVQSAVEVARDAADMVMLTQDLRVLKSGIREGRRTLVNIRKYILMATSSNFGNMASMAASTVMLPFLPMRPVQILLNNLLYDASEMALPLDRVDDRDLLAPVDLDLGHIARFMAIFGGLSSLFDLLAFYLFAHVLRASEPVFQGAWFVQSVITQVLVIFIMRTHRPFWKDRPAGALILSCAAVVSLAIAMPAAPWASLLGFSNPPTLVWAALLALTLGYLMSMEALKSRFYLLQRT